MKNADEEISFASKLNSYVEQRNKKAVGVSLKKYDDAIIIEYTEEIKQLCTKAAKAGRRYLKGFFVPQYTDYNYETTIEGPYVIEKPMGHAQDKPSHNILYGGLIGGNLDLSPAAAHCSATDTIRNGILARLANAGFRKLEITIVYGKSYKVKEILFSNIVVATGTLSYLYLDIEW